MNKRGSHIRVLLMLALCALLAAITPTAPGSAESSGASPYTYADDEMTASFVGGELMTTVDGEPALVLYYDFTNAKAKAESFIYSFAVTVYQDGIECDPAYSWDFAEAPADAYSSLIGVKDGATIRVAKYFRIRSISEPLDMELSRMFAFGATPMSLTLELPDVEVLSSSMADSDTQEIAIKFTSEEAQAIVSAALLEGKTPAEWLHDAALALIEPDAE